MASDPIHVVDPPDWLLLLLWAIVILGFFAPKHLVGFLPEFTWAGKTATAHAQSLKSGQWIEPWQPIDQETFVSAWVRCTSLSDALALDRKLDDGHLHRGRLVLAEGGMAWIPE